MPFDILVLIMLNLLRKSLKLELHNFYAKINKQFKEATTSAFIQNRHKIKPELFYDINKLLVSEYYTDNDLNVNLYKGHRLLAVDGSTINLPVNKNTITNYGVFMNQKINSDLVIARVSILYDVLNNIVLDGLLTNYKLGEVSLSRQHLAHTNKNDLIIFDRAYPNFQTAFLIREQEADYIFRCKTVFNNLTKAFVSSNKKDWVTDWLPAQNKSYKHLPYTKTEKIKVRFIKVKLRSGDTEILMTSLTDKNKYLYKDFKQLYFKRWAVETFYDRFKNLIQVERFSGKSHLFIQQEFNCALYASNMQTILTNDIAVEKQLKIKYKNRSLEYKVNQSISLGFIRDKLIKVFVAENKNKEEILQELKQLFVLNVVPIRPNRTNKREQGKYRKRTKPIQFSNKRIVL